METKRVVLNIVVEMNTNKPMEEIHKAIEKGIYRGLDTLPYYIAQPKDVLIIIDPEL